MFSEELKFMFTNVSFLAFLLVLIPVYFLIPKKGQWICLLVASYVFYFFTSSALPVYMLVATVSIYFGARKIDKINCEHNAYLEENKASLSREDKAELKKASKKKKKLYLIPCVVVNLGMLVVLKYGNMFIGTANSLFSSSIPLMNLALPLGISYYTLQSIGYLIDIYKGRYRCETNFFKLSLFVSFFAQIIQGPFGRFDHLAHQLYEEHNFCYERLKSGLVLMLWGYFKKLVIADKIGPAVEAVFADVPSYNGMQFLFTAILFSFQVYADFSGYMDIASGVCEILGIDLAKNFDRPFFSKSVEEYWRRWHITLGAWFKDYVFFPLSVSKPAVNLSKKCRKKGHLKLAKLLPSYFALIFVWCLTGLWHGASWKYVLWGAGNCIFIILSMQFETVFDKIKKSLKIKENNIIWRSFRIVRTFFIISLLRVFSRIPTFGDIGLFYKKLFTMADISSWDLSTFFPGIDGFDVACIIVGAAVFYIISMLQFKYPQVRKQLFTKNYFVQSVVIILLIFTILIFGTYGSGIDVAGFIYAKF